MDDFDPEPSFHKNPVLTPAFTNVNGIHFLSPEDVATIYNFTPLYSAGVDGTGQKIAVGGRTLVDLADFRAFRRRFNLTANDPTLVVVPGSDPGVGADDDIGETNLDIQWSSAAAPNASIFLVYARSVFTAAQYAVDQNVAPVFSLSYGGCESAIASSTIALLRGVAQQANAQGITWVASTGDVGAAGCERQDILTQATRGMAVQAPAALPEITAVGGTEFDEGGGNYWRTTTTANGGSAISYIPEKAWNDTGLLFGLASTTGGMSTLFPKPAWQTGPGVPADNARMVPDVSFSSSWNHDSWITYLNGSAGGFGGTSVAAPVFAGVLALLNQSLITRGVLNRAGLGNINPALYRLAQTTPGIFHDIVTGDNIVPCAQGSPNCGNGSFGYRAGTGYDLATGLGSIDVANFVNRWTTGTATATSVSVDSNTVPFSGSLTLTASVSPATASGVVTFANRNFFLGSATVNGGIATLTVSAFKLPAGNSTITAAYPGGNQLTGSTGTVQVSVTTPAAGSAVVPSITPDPILRQPPDTNGFSWFFTITLSERAGVATTLTGLQMLGRDYSSQIVSLFRQATIPAKGSITGQIGFAIASPPTTGEFVFSGVDADGRAWTGQISAQFQAERLLVPWVAMTTVPGTADSKASSDPACAYQDQVVLQENSGYEIDLAKLTAASADLSSNINQIFGTTHLAPFGTLLGQVCWNAEPASTSRYTLTGTTEAGATTSATASVTAINAPSTPGAFIVSKPSVTLIASDPGQSSTTTFDLQFGGAQAKWSLSIYPSNSQAGWLSVSPTSGTGAAQIGIKAIGNGLSNGVYHAILSFSAQGSLPQRINVPVMFVVGGGHGTEIGGVSNGASFKTAFAPGMVLSVFGSNLSPGTQAADRIPLSITMQGVSATVNGVTAPLYYVSPSQINLQVPYETGAGPAVVGINNNFQTAGFIFDVTPAAPGIFTGVSSALVPFNSGRRGVVLLAFITGEGDIAPALFTGRTPPGSTAVAKLPKPLLPVTVTVGGVNAPIVFAGIPPGLAGVTQINFTIPANAPLGDQPVVVTVGGVASPAARLTIAQ